MATAIHGSRFVDLTGVKFGHLTVIEFHGKNHNGSSKWSCRCDCGKEVVAYAGNLTKPNHTTSCGCHQSNVTAKRSLKHGHAKRGNVTRTWSIWSGMVARCTKQYRNNWKYYGGRGITVCDRWKSFENFLEDMGECPDGLTIERSDPNGNYSLSNCKWATWSDQRLNKRPKTI